MNIIVFPLSLLSTKMTHGANFIKKLMKYFVLPIRYLLHVRRKAHRCTFHLSNTWWGHRMETPSAFTDPLWGEFTGQRWIPLTKVSDAELWCFLFDLRLNKRFSKPSKSRWLRCNRAHYDVTVKQDVQLFCGHGKEALVEGIQYLRLDWSSNSHDGTFHLLYYC